MSRLARLVALCALVLPTAHACNVPVFRYALERWPADLHLLIFNRPADAADERMKALTTVLNEHSHHLNLAVELPAEAPVFGGSPLAARLQFPHNGPVWYEGPVDAATLAGLVDSPLRQRIREDLVSATSATWILLSGRDAAVSSASFAMLRERLTYQAKHIELPVKSEEDLDWGGGGGGGGRPTTNMPLRVAFSTHELARGTPAEWALERQIAAMAPKAYAAGEPIALAVFGRGRGLPLAGSELSVDRVDADVAFILGACSCEVKELNPGYDLLMAAAWDDEIFDWPNRHAAVIPPEFRAAPSTAPAVPATVIAAAPVTASATAQTTPMVGGISWLVLAAGAAAVLILAFLLAGGRRS
jgi:hypothetical protein